ncbi:endogenous retrovirus group k member 25 pol [Limosa lapponica baueri]|uniref:ribonuclease H n=1 Tax=Limosa lapponica baueri TaxID=1758121 RepID=A0A2I0T935_LIMLA|nr:endogenous retrovirus group k member 25 pol [Limosa lapponica baueri]
MGGPQPGVGFVSIPLNSGDVREFKKEMGHLLEDPLGVAERFDQFLGPNIYTWDELESILKILFTSEERGMIRMAGMRHWDQRHQHGPAGDLKWPLQRPNWDNQDPAHRNNMVDLRDMIIQGIRDSVPRGQNINKAFSEQQKKDETPTEWRERLRKSLQLYSGLDPDSQVGQALLKTQFVAKSWTDIRKKLEKIEDWQEKGLDELLREAQKVYVRREEESQKKQAKIFMAAIREGQNQEDEAKVNPEVWCSPDSVGRLNIKPITVSIRDPDQPIRVKQYPIPREGQEGLQPVIERLLAQGLLEPCMSPHNTPILPVKKTDGSYCLVQDLRTVNERTITRFPVVANPHTILNQLSPDYKWYSVIDLKDAFWACPLDEEARDYFAFEWEDPRTRRKQQLRWTVLPQGFTESPNLFGQALEQLLESYELGQGLILIQYVDDLLIAGKTQEEVRNESIKLLNFLGLKGLKVSKPKLQFTEEEVKYLGHWLTKGYKKLDPERVRGILLPWYPESSCTEKRLCTYIGIA